MRRRRRVIQQLYISVQSFIVCLFSDYGHELHKINCGVKKCRFIAVQRAHSPRVCSIMATLSDLNLPIGYILGLIVSRGWSICLQTVGF